MDGTWHVLEPCFRDSLTEIALMTAAQQGWPLSNVPKAEAAALLQVDGYDPR